MHKGTDLRHEFRIFCTSVPTRNIFLRPRLRELRRPDAHGDYRTSRPFLYNAKRET